VAQR
jgi:hypothetical protein